MFKIFKKKKKVKTCKICGVKLSDNVSPGSESVGMCFRCFEGARTMHDMRKNMGIGMMDLPKKDGDKAYVCYHEKEYDEKVILTSYPPRVKWACKKCGFEGYDNVR